MRAKYQLVIGLLATVVNAAPVILPDGSIFKTWEVPLHFTRTYYVAQQARNASDDNPGTVTQPFRTIQRAADLLQPGERVVIGAGVYRECVHPARGGSGPDKMISYEAAPGERPVISGAELFTGTWSADPQQPGIWCASLPARWFTGVNPFREANLSPVSRKLFADKKKKMADLGADVEKRSGLVFENGRHLSQVLRRQDLRRGTFCVSADGMTLFVWPFDRDNPQRAFWEMTTRAQCFTPIERGLGYIRVKGLTFEKGGNPFPIPQLGLLSTNAGHHWLIEDNTVRWANSVGIDIGRQTWLVAGPTGLGDHIVRHNFVTDCGITGICGIGAGKGERFTVAATDNVLRCNGWQDAERMWESGGIKFHFLTDSLIAHNWVADTSHGAGIWLDNDNCNNLCDGNVIRNNQSRTGALFIECSAVPNLVVSNVIWQSTSAGIYEHDSRSQNFRDNFVGHTTGPGIYLRGKISARPKLGVGHHEVTGNVFFATEEPIKAVAPENIITNNITTGVAATLARRTQQLQWSVSGESITIVNLSPPTEHD